MKIEKREYQDTAVKKAIQYFKKNDRGKITMPCGSGKTIVALKICDQLKATRVIVCVPNLTLENQLFNDWYSYFKNKYKILCIGSDVTIGNDKVLATTDTSLIKDFFSNHNKCIVISTYHSVDLIPGNVVFDFAIIDEAHRTVGNSDRMFSTILFDEQIKISKRLFMTATEKFYSNSNSEDIVSMDNEAIYGQTIYSLTVKEAIDLNVLNDYVLKSLVITKKEIEEMVAENAIIIDDTNIIDDYFMKEVSAALAIIDSIKKKEIKHVLTYHKTIKNAKRFRMILSKLAAIKGIPLNTFHINGSEHKGANRQHIIKAFEFSDIGALTSAKALVEGIDIPCVDAICFVDFKKSSLEIIQALGRSFRKHKGKNVSQIICPAIEGKEADYEMIYDTIKALASYDQRIISFFKKQSESEQAEQNPLLKLHRQTGVKIDLSKIEAAINYTIQDKLNSHTS